MCGNNRPIPSQPPAESGKFVDARFVDAEFVVSEFVWDLATNGKLDEAFQDHVRAADGRCTCGLPYKCGTRLAAEQALELTRAQTRRPPPSG